VVKLLTEDCKDLTGGQLNVEKDPVKAADDILANIELKREKLGI
jgi:carbon-monoxide dehydrogenase catalytic subunit